MATAKHLLELFLTDCAIAIGIKHPEGPLQVFTREKQVFLECCSDELRIVNLTITI